MKRKPRTLAFWRGRLPHWEVEDGRYFVTLHLAGAIPEAGQRRIRELAARIRPTACCADDSLRTTRLVFGELEAWLDRCEHVCHFRRPEIAAAVREAIEHRNGRVWTVIEYVLMPNHLHLFFELGRDQGLRAALHSFKKWTSTRLGELPDAPAQPFWQREWFDHWSRSDEEDERIAVYIRNNPVKAGLVTDFAAWPFGSWNREAAGGIR